MSIKEKQDRLPTLYWLPKLHKRPYKARFIANSSSCTTTVLSKLLSSCLSAVRKHWIRYCDTVYERDGINYFWSIKNSNDVLNRFKSKTFQASKLSTYDFSTLYTTLPHHLITDKLIDLIDRTFIRENTLYLAGNEECALFSSSDTFFFWHFFFLDLNLSISNDTVSTKNYDKRDDFYFDIVNFPFLDGDVPQLTSYGVYISQH